MGVKISVWGKCYLTSDTSITHLRPSEFLHSPRTEELPTGKWEKVILSVFATAHCIRILFFQKIFVNFIIFRFCAECKSKVLRAYSLLVGEVDKNNEKGYCPALYDGLKCCTGEKHIHVLCETDFIAHLIGRAEPELTGRYSVKK